MPAGLAAPASLNTGAKEIWQQLGGELARQNMLRLTDRNAFLRYCNAFERWMAAAKTLADEGVTYTSTSAHGDLKRIHPMFIVEERLSKRLEVLEARFGLTPADRQALFVRMSQGSLFGGTPTIQPVEDTAPTPAPAPASPIGMLANAIRH